MLEKSKIMEAEEYRTLKGLSQEKQERQILDC